MKKNIKLEFDGYWREPNIDVAGGIPNSSGVYCVYECSYREQPKHFSVTKLIYIGESGTVRDRIKGHKKWPKWRKECGSGKQICFTFAPRSATDRERAEAAMIFEHKPPVNTEYKDTFPFDETTMSLSGKIHLLTPQFTVKRKD